MSSPSKKPYRRFRAHGRAPGDTAKDLAALRELNEAPPKARERTPKRPAAPRPTKPPARMSKRRWWSLRGVGKSGVVARVLGVLLVVAIGWATLGYFALRGAASDANSRISNTARRALADPKGGLLGTAQNVLVIGSDADRDRTGARADTIMIMRTDPEAGVIRYLSIPRDLRVAYPGQGNIKIGESFAYGGNRGVIRSIERTIGIPIHHVMVIDFKGVAKMVDAVGGIALQNPYDLRDCTYPGGQNVSFPKGRLTLDGDQALVYSRVRSCDGDVERARRQQLVVASLKSKVVSWSGLPKAPWRGAKIVRAMSTDLSATDLAKLGWLQGKLTTGPKDRDVLAGEGTTIGGTFYFLYDPARAEPQVERFQGRG